MAVGVVVSRNSRTSPVARSPAISWRAMMVSDEPPWGMSFWEPPEFPSWVHPWLVVSKLPQAPRRAGVQEAPLAKTAVATAWTFGGPVVIAVQVPPFLRHSNCWTMLLAGPEVPSYSQTAIRRRNVP